MASSPWIGELWGGFIMRTSLRDGDTLTTETLFLGGVFRGVLNYWVGGGGFGEECFLKSLSVRLFG